MGTLITKDDLDSATWIVGERGDKHGVCVTISGVVVKYGRHVRAQREATTINLIRAACPQVPVPEALDAWEEGEGEDAVGYLAMSRMPGAMLSECWPTMEQPQRERVLNDLEGILQQLRAIEIPTTALIGAVDGGPAADVRARHAEFGGPFTAESEFNEWLASLIHPESMQYRAIIDWEFAGWHPEYWEYLKMVQFSRDPVFRCFARGCWKDKVGNQVFFDEEFVIDQMLDGQVRHGKRVIKRPR
ncbi:hypothetical protein McaMca56_006837 [Microsporum canis]